MKIPNEKRKEYPVYSGFLTYFPDAIMLVANHSWKANQKHNPGEPLHWDKTKSSDEKDALVRHLIDYAKGEHTDEDGLEVDVAIAWRAMANLQRRIDSQ